MFLCTDVVVQIEFRNFGMVAFPLRLPQRAFLSSLSSPARLKRINRFGSCSSYVVTWSVVVEAFYFCTELKSSDLMFVPPCSTERIDLLERLLFPHSFGGGILNAERKGILDNGNW